VPADCNTRNETQHPSKKLNKSECNGNRFFPDTFMRFGVAGTILGRAVTSEAGRKRAQHGKMICSRRQSSVIYCVMSIPNKVKLFYSFCCFQAWKKSFFSIWLLAILPFLCAAVFPGILFAWTFVLLHSENSNLSSFSFLGRRRCLSSFLRFRRR
jgi:hypothetical protein